MNFKTEVIICGDVYVNYLIDSKNKSISILNFYNLFDKVDFPTTSIIDNIFIDYSRFNIFMISHVEMVILSWCITGNNP